MTGAGLPPVARLRTLHGRSTRAWVGEGRLELGEHHWVALSGVAHPDYNLALCHGERGAAEVGACVETLTRARRPAILALAGEAAEHTDPLTEAGWRQVGSAPLMTRSLAVPPAPPPRTRRLDKAGLDAARDLVARTFGLPEDIAEVALPPHPVAGRTVWGAFDGDDTLVACAIGVREDEASVIWSMATDPQRRREGHGARVLDAALAGAAAEGCTVGVLHASAAGEPFYLARGYTTVERWAFWSRPRWVLAG